MACYSLLTLCLWWIASGTAFAHAFFPSPRAVRCRHDRRRPAPLFDSPDDPPAGDGGGSGEDDGDGGDPLADELLLDELRNAKKDMFGADIPTTDELRDATQNAEDAFLAAMREQTQKFRQIKLEEGSERAVEAFIGQIEEEDEARRRLEEGGVDNGDIERGEDSIDEKRSMQDTSEVSEDDDRLEGIHDKSDDDWQ